MAGNKKTKIYTRKGDKGLTSLIGGKRVPKHNLRIEAYGTVDELNSVTGMLRDRKECKKHMSALLKIQDRLFTVESLLAAVSEKSAARLPGLRDKDIADLESEIDRLNDNLPDLKNFILPGGHPAVSWAQIARTVCRRAERTITKIAVHENIDEIILRYMNRLSDYFFILARRLSFDLRVKEVRWNVK